jgi:ABC-type transport system substrate-binding protein
MQRRTRNFPILALCFFLGACLLADTRPGDAALPPRSGGELTLGVTHSLALLDPALAGASGERQAAMLVTEPLFDFDGQTVSGRLALKWREEEEEGRVLRIFLKPGLRFHDGSVMGANDVVASLTRLLGGGARYPIARKLLPIAGSAGLYGNRRITPPAGLRAVSEVELEIRFGAPTPGFARVLADPATAILPASQQRGEGDIARPSASSARLSVRAFDDYHGGRPYLDRVTLLATDSVGAERRAWDAGEIDGIVYPRIPTDSATGTLSGALGMAVVLAPNPALSQMTRQNLTRLATTFAPCKDLVKLFESRRIAPVEGEAVKGPVTVRGPDAQLETFTALMKHATGNSCQGFKGDAAAAQRFYAKSKLPEALVILARADQPELAMTAQRLALLAQQAGIPITAKVLPPSAFIDARAKGKYAWELLEVPLGLMQADDPAYQDAATLYRVLARLTWHSKPLFGAVFSPYGQLELGSAYRRTP